MMTQIMMPRYAPAPSSPAQVRAAGRLRASDVRDATEPTGPPFHQSSLITIVEEERLHCFGRVVTTAFPSEVPTPGRRIRSGRGLHCGTDHAPVIGRPILSNPIRWRRARRPRTEARARRNGRLASGEGFDNPPARYRSVHQVCFRSVECGAPATARGPLCAQKSIYLINLINSAFTTSTLKLPLTFPSRSFALSGSTTMSNLASMLQLPPSLSRVARGGSSQGDRDTSRVCGAGHSTGPVEVVEQKRVLKKVAQSASSRLNAERKVVLAMKRTLHQLTTLFAATQWREDLVFIGVESLPPRSGVIGLQLKCESEGEPQSNWLSPTSRH
jgi:hypothetical protein